MKNNKRWWILCIAILGVLVLAGCSDDDDDDVVFAPAPAGGCFVPVSVSTIVPDEEGNLDVNWELNPEFGDEGLVFDGIISFLENGKTGTFNCGLSLGYEGRLTPWVPLGEDDNLGEYIPVVPSLTGGVKSVDVQDTMSWSLVKSPGVDGGTVESWIDNGGIKKRACEFDDQGRLLVQFVCERADKSSPWIRKAESKEFGFDRYSTRHVYIVDENGRVETERVCRLKADRAEGDALTDADWNVEEYTEYSNDYSTDKVVMQTITSRYYDKADSSYHESKQYARFTHDDAGNLVEWLKDGAPLDGAIPCDDELDGYLRRSFDGLISTLEFKMDGDTTCFDYTYDDNGCLYELKISSSSDDPLTFSIAWEKRSGLSEKARALLSRENLSEGVSLLLGYQLYSLCGS